jgi:hypothetical protein
MRWRKVKGWLERVDGFWLELLCFAFLFFALFRHLFWLGIIISVVGIMITVFYPGKQGSTIVWARNNGEWFFGVLGFMMFDAVMLIRHIWP